MNDQNILGFVIESKGKFLCWNSFKSCWFWGHRKLSEIFNNVKRAGELAKEYNAQLYAELEKGTLEKANWMVMDKKLEQELDHNK